MAIVDTLGMSGNTRSSPLSPTMGVMFDTLTRYMTIPCPHGDTLTVSVNIHL